jgi:hypothetical protein
MNTTNAEEVITDAVVIQEAPEQTSAVAITKLAGFSNMQEALDHADVLIRGKHLPSSLKTPEAVVSIMLMGKELGMDPMASISNIVSIQGKPVLGIHAIGALLRKAGCASQTIHDFEPVMGTEGETAGKVVDYKTVIRFFRPYNGKTMEEDVTFTWKDAVKMELASKDNWKRMPRIMLWSRCFSIGARRVAPDALLGMYEVSEWADVTNQRYTVTEDGEATIIQ